MGCVEGAGSTSGTGGQTAAGPTTIRGASNREVEAPDVFQVTDSGLWDGRPSLGGIWVASPNVTDPERVVILNPATGKSVNGALFRRERENPGPRLQVSSDAAEALGMLAGQPTELRVTALRRATEAAPDAAPDAAVEATAAPATVTAGVTDAAAGDSAAAETAALATAALAVTGAATDAAVAVDGSVEAAATEPAKPKTWKERRAEAKARRDAEKAAKAAAAAAAAEAAAEVEGDTAATVDTAAVAAIETAPLDARSSEGAADDGTTAGTEAVPAPAPEKKKTRREIREEQAAAEAAAAAATETTAPAAAAGRSIQIASFSKEENASRAVDTLAKVGISAQVQRSEQSGKIVWGVVTAGDAATLASIKDAGFADAFFLN